MALSEKIVGRKAEQKTLSQFFESDKAEFLAIYGRRRVGKTFLIRSFFKKKNCIFFNTTGIYDGSLSRQLEEFTKDIGRVFFQGADLQVKENWFDLFALLTEALQTQAGKNKKIVLFFDEFPWMATARSKLVQALDHYWNHFWSQDRRIKLVICGSAASWIIKNIVKSKGGLHNRLTRSILLEPMHLHEVRDLLLSLGVKLGSDHILQIYMMTGGIPFYLSHVEPGLSASQIIEHLAFSKNGVLLDEFGKLYASLFGNAGIYVALIRACASCRYGISQDELLQKVKVVSKGGVLTSKLEDLENTGFIVKFTPYGSKKKGIYYRVIDEYTLFYFYWIEPIKETLSGKNLRSGYWDKIRQSSSWQSWAGYAFESVCYKHLNQISESLGLSPTAISCGWRYVPKATGEKGAQIDLLFDRDDGAITLCEMKYTKQPFAIDKEYEAKLCETIRIFQEKTGTKKQIFLSFVSASGIKKTAAAEELVSGVVTLEDLFKA